MKWRVNYSILLCVFLVACNSTNKSNTTVMYFPVVESNNLTNEPIRLLIYPYKEALDSQMNEVLIYLEEDLTKELPEGTLGNFVCDELINYVERDTSIVIDFCVLNNGGLRVSSISKGIIRTTKIYELLPFENTLEIIEMEGIECAKLFNSIAQQGGAPLSGVRFDITHQQAVAVEIQGKLFNQDKRYFILTSNYLADGGEEFMKNVVTRRSLGLKLRDCMIEQLRIKQSKNEPIKINKDGRIKNY